MHQQIFTHDDDKGRRKLILEAWDLDDPYRMLLGSHSASLDTFVWTGLNQDSVDRLADALEPYRTPVNAALDPLGVGWDQVADYAEAPAPRETWRIEGSTVTRIRTEETTLQNVHREEDCQAPCTLHSPTEHHMRDWPLKWDPSQPAFFRECPHAELHHDPDARVGSMVWLTDCGYAECDGCCVPTDETAERLASFIATSLDGSWVDFQYVTRYKAAVGPDSGTDVTVFVPAPLDDSLCLAEYRITIERVGNSSPKPEQFTRAGTL